MKATIVPVTLDNIDLVAETTKKYGFPRSERWIKRLLFDPNVPEGRELDSRGALIISDKNECVGMYCWTPCSIYLRQKRMSAYTGALLGVDKKYSPWILDVIDRSMKEINDRLSYGNDVASKVSSKFWTELGSYRGPEGGDVTDQWVTGLCSLSYLSVNHALWLLGLRARWLSKIAYWLCLPFHVLLEPLYWVGGGLIKCLGKGSKWKFKVENGFSDERFESFWERFLAANEGVISSREPATLRWKFDESIQAGAVLLISAECERQVDGYVLLRKNPIDGAVVSDYGICDICAVGNDAKCLTELLGAAIQYCRQRFAIRLTYVGMPFNKKDWVVRWLHHQSKLPCNPFSYSCKDQSLIKAIQANKGWFFGPYDGERCMGYGRYVDL